MQAKMWRIIKGMYEPSRIAVLLDGEETEVLDVEQGVAQGCSLSQTLFSAFIMVVVQQVGLGKELSDGDKV